MKSRCLIVLGMHRSGTSALSGVLHLLGVRLGSSLIPADPDVNAKGYWEHSIVSGINESILRNLGYSWLDERALPEQWWKKQELRSLRTELIELLKDDLEGPGLWAVKDPRICRLLPFWLDILTELECRPHFLIITRHPSEVALSLSRRNHIQPWKSTLLWLRYLLDSEYYSRGYPRVFLTYEELLTSWGGLLEPVAQTLSIEWPIAPTKIHKELTQFLDTKLRHHQVGTHSASQDSYVGIATDAYKLLSQDLTSFQNTQSTLLIRLEKAVKQHGDCLTSINEYLLTIEKHELQVRTLEGVRNALEQEIVRIKATVSWRITAPLRTAWNLYQRMYDGWKHDANIKR